MVCMVRIHFHLIKLNYLFYEEKHCSTRFVNYLCHLKGKLTLTKPNTMLGFLDFLEPVDVLTFSKCVKTGVSQSVGP